MNELPKEEEVLKSNEPENQEIYLNKRGEVITKEERDAQIEDGLDADGWRGQE